MTEEPCVQISSIAGLLKKCTCSLLNPPIKSRQLGAISNGIDSLSRKERQRADLFSPLQSGTRIMASQIATAIGF